MSHQHSHAASRQAVNACCAQTEHTDTEPWHISAWLDISQGVEHTAGRIMRHAACELSCWLRPGCPGTSLFSRELLFSLPPAPGLISAGLASRPQDHHQQRRWCNQAAGQQVQHGHTCKAMMLQMSAQHGSRAGPEAARAAAACVGAQANWLEPLAAPAVQLAIHGCMYWCIQKAFASML